MDKELEQFQADLLQSVRQMKTGAAVKITKVEIPAAAETRAKVGMSQNDFAALMGVSKRTLQEWEQGRRKPSGAAKTLLKIAASHPETLRELNAIGGQ